MTVSMSSVECSSAALQAGDDLTVHHARFARQHALHPQIAIAVHLRVQTAFAMGRQLDDDGIAEPCGDEPGQREQIEVGE
jgi:hypothetical protein